MRCLLLAALVGCGSGSPSTPPAPGDQPDGASVSDAPPAASCDANQPQPLDATWNLMVGSTMRVARVHVPASYDPHKPTPLLFDVHGRTSNASGEMSLSLSVPKSDAAGFIAIYPESATSPTSWNSGTCCDPANTTNVDDTGFFKQLLDEAGTRLCIDPSRVYMMGMSNGAYESFRLGCEMSDRLAAIGPVAGLLLFQGCQPANPMPVMMINGTSDPLSQYQYVAQGASFWKQHNGCTSSSTTYQNGDTTCVTSGGCNAGADVTVCTVQDGGHQWPGGGVELPFLGKKSNDINSTDALWDFFVAHPRG